MAKDLAKRMKKILVPVILVLVLLGTLSLLGKGRSTENKTVVSPTPSVTEAVIPEVTETAESETLALEISSPQNGATVSNSTITVSGKTAPNIQVFVNEKELIADTGGNFSTTIELFEGENSIFIVANNNVGEYVEKEITVTLETTE